MKEKVFIKYLGDYIHNQGTGASVLRTVKNRFGGISSNIIEDAATESPATQCPVTHNQFKLNQRAAASYCPLSGGA
jgi:hypothetical protein